MSTEERAGYTPLRKMTLREQLAMLFVISLALACFACMAVMIVGTDEHAEPTPQCCCVLCEEK